MSNPNKATEWKLRRSADEVSRRARSVWLLVIRAEAEAKPRWPKERFEHSWSAIELIGCAQALAREWGAEGWLSANENRLMATKLGSWRGWEIAFATWQIECVVLFRWCLRRGALPPIWRKTPMRKVLIRAAMNSQRSAWAETAVLRPKNEIRKAYRETAIWYWRSRMWPLESGGFVRVAAQGEVSHAIAARVRRAPMFMKRSGGDLVVGKTRYAELDERDPELHMDIDNISALRAWCFHWLGGALADWDLGDVPVPSEGFDVASMLKPTLLQDERDAAMRLFALTADSARRQFAL